MIDIEALHDDVFNPTETDLQYALRRMKELNIHRHSPTPQTNAAEFLPHTDQFMQGDRYGSIRARRNNGEVLVYMDKSKRLLWCKPEHIKEYYR